MPRSEEQNEAIRRERRTRILEQALALFAQHGYDRTTVRMIAQEAGIAQGLLYNYFRSKKDVLQALFEQSMAKVYESFALVVDRPATEKLEALIRDSFALVQRDRDFWKVSYGVRMQSAVLSDLGPALGMWADSVRLGLSAILAEAGIAEPEVEARVLFAMIDGISQHLVLDPAYPIEAVTAALLRRYFPKPSKKTPSRAAKQAANAPDEVGACTKRSFTNSERSSS